MSDPAARRPRPPRRPARRWPLLALVAPYIGLLYPAWYAREAPHLWGFPFFYWYQFAWILFTAALTGTVYLLTHEPDVRAAEIDEQTGHGDSPAGTVQ